MELNIGFAKITEAAKYLNLSKAMVNKMVRDNRIPSKRFGKVYRIPWSWLSASTTDVTSAIPSAPIEAKVVEPASAPKHEVSQVDVLTEIFG